MQARRSSLYKASAPPGVVLPSTYAYYKFDTRQSNAEVLINSEGAGQCKVGLEDSLTNAYPASSIGGYSLRCRTGSSGGIARFYSDTGETGFHINDSGSDKPFTITTWVYPQNSNFRLSSIYSENSSNAQYFCGFEGSNKPYLYIVDGASSAKSIRYLADSPIALNNWHHFSCTYDGSRHQNGIAVYIDGVLVPGTRSNVGGFVFVRSSSSRMRTLQLISTVITYGVGYIDEWRFYQQALTDEQVMADYLRNPDPG